MTELGDRVHLSRAHVYRRIIPVRSAGVIRGFSGDVDVAVVVRAAPVDELRDVVLRRIALLEAVHWARTLVVLDELVKSRPVPP